MIFTQVQKVEDVGVPRFEVDGKRTRPFIATLKFVNFYNHLLIFSSDWDLEFELRVEVNRLQYKMVNM